MVKRVNDGLNPEPTRVQLYLFKRHKKAGTTPGNPRWYRNPAVKAFEFIPNQKPIYPRWTCR